MGGVEDKMGGVGYKMREGEELRIKKREGEYKKRDNNNTVKQISPFSISEIFLFILRF